MRDLEKVHGYEDEGAGIRGFGKARLYAKVCFTALVVSAAVYAYCAAYVFTTGISLLETKAITIAFFVSLVATILAMLGSLVCAVKLRSVDKYDLSIMIPGGNFDDGGLIISEGKYVKGGSVKAEITVNGVANRSFTGFNVVSVALALAMGASLCCFAAALGILVAQTPSIVGVAGALSSPGGVVAQVCLMALSVFVTAAAVDILKNELFDSGSRLLILEEGAKRISEDDVVCIADKLNVGTTNIAHVKIYKVMDPARAEASVLS